MDGFFNEGPHGGFTSPDQSAVGALGRVPAVTEDCTSRALSACVFGPLNIFNILASKIPSVEALLVGAGIQPSDFIFEAAFDWDLIPSGVMIEEAHILTRQELEADDQTMSDLLEQLGLLLSPHRALIFTPCNQYCSIPYLDQKHCAYRDLIEFHKLQRLKHDYNHLVLTQLVDRVGGDANSTGSSGVEFSRDSDNPGPGDGGSQREDEDPTGPPDDSPQDKPEGGGQEDDCDNNEGKSLNVKWDSKVHFKVIFKVLNIQTIRVEGSLSSKVGSRIRIS